MSTRIEHNIPAGRYELFVDDRIAGYTEYTQRDGARDFNHTLTYPQYRGHGIAAQVVEFALTDTRQEGLTVIPTCWYVDEFIGRNSEFADLVQ
jgi:predicted GNAT family acetyltransferase